MRIVLLGLLFSLLWGSGFIAVKTGLPFWPVYTFAFLRFLIAGGLLLLVLRLRGVPLPAEGRTYAAIFLLSLFHTTLFYVAAYSGLGLLSAGVASVAGSTSPLMLAALAPLTLGERITRPQVVGMAVGFAGVVLVASGRVDEEHTYLLGIVLMLSAALLITVATILFKRLPLTSNLWMVNCLQLLMGGAVLAVLALLTEDVTRLPDAPLALLSLFYLIGVISIFAFWLWFYLLRQGEASRIAAFHFLGPAWGLFLAWLLLDEDIDALQFLGFAFVAAGLFLVIRSRPVRS